MALGNFNKLTAPLRKIEGGIADRSKKADPGGLTNKGVTHKTYDAYRINQGLPTRSVKEITNDEVIAIYREFWDAVQGDLLPSGLDWAVYDFAFNSGAGRAVMELQEVLGCNVDGQIGQQTRKAIGAADLPKLINLYCDDRLKFMKRLSNWGENKNGWTKRVAEVRAAALDMANPDTPTLRRLTVPSLPAGANAKAHAENTSAAKSPEAQGLAMLASGLSGEKVRQATEVVQPHAGMDTPLGRAAFVLFAVLSVIGFVLVALPWLKRAQRMGLFGGFTGKVFR